MSFLERMKKLALLLFALSLALSGHAFVSVDGTKLMRNGKPYRFVGTNFWYGPILASKGSGGDRQRLHRELDSLQAMGVCNLRVLIGSDGKPGVKTKVQPTLQTAPGVYNDTILDGLDYFMAELQKRDMQAVLYFNNSWEWSGGYGFYLEEVQKIGKRGRQKNGGIVKSPMSSDVSWNDYCKFYSQFSTNTKAQELFYDHIRHIIRRTNRYTGKPYVEDPAIFSWQIGNEPRAFSHNAKEAFAQWIAKSAALIRSLDPNHLISVGSEGIVGCEGDADLYRRICTDPNIDVLNLHLWPTNWGWSGKTVQPGDLQRSILKSTDYLNKHVAVAKAIGKPLVLEEFGYPRDGGSLSLDSKVESRNQYYTFIFAQLLKSVNEGSPLVGANFWGWAGEARPKHEAWQPGDDYTCDPAHEPQGLFSVFSSDLSTINIIRYYASRLNQTTEYAIPWRGVMIDVSRHFMPLPYLYKEVDALAHFGMNRLHLHLTDDAGWRMEIKSHPRLTDIGAWRPAKRWEDWNASGKGYSDSQNGFGGFYTQEELRELVAYAALRGVEIVPEIEFPAHSAEVVAAYPEVGNEKNELNMRKPETYRLMRDVLEEVARVFPSEYIHMGGDEAATQHELQPDGMRKIKQIIDSLGRKMIVWDEALTDNPSDSDMVVMVWRNISTAQRAAQLGHEVILTPGKYCYLDKAQDCPATEPKAAGGCLSADDVYDLPNPFDEGLAHKLLGVQGNLWTERMDNAEYAEYMLWPRAFAIAELGRIGLDTRRDHGAFRQRAIEAATFLRDSLHINAFDLQHEGGPRHVRPQTTLSPATKLTYNTLPHKAYAGSSADCLTDKVCGGWNFGDGTWQGFLGRGGMDVTIDLGKTCDIKSVKGDFLQCCGPEIFFPYNMTVTVSSDGINYQPLYNGQYADIYSLKHEDYQQLGWQGKASARYIRMQALPGPKQGWVFCSEVMVDTVAVYVSNRPEKRRFNSKAVELRIAEVARQLTNPKLKWMFVNCFPNTLDTTTDYEEDADGNPDTYIYTGDIHAMWLRDSGAQVYPYLPLAGKEAKLQKMIKGVILRQFKCINCDPYANAFNKEPQPNGIWMKDTGMHPELHERKYEIDSHCYPIRLAYGYWKQTGDSSVFGDDWLTAIGNVLKVWREQQRKNGLGSYRFLRTTNWATDCLPLGGYGAPVKPCGLIASGFRPSDDATIFPFLIPSNFMAATSLEKAAEILTSVNHNSKLAADCAALAAEVRAALKEHAVYDHPKYGKIYAYEVDGFGNHLLMDDANVPSLLAMPYMGDVAVDDPVYQNTRRFVWSEDNPYFFSGKAGEGIGGPHIGYDHIWPMSIIMKAFTSQDDNEIRQCLLQLVDTDGGKGFIHESFHKDDATRFTRPWFAWANTLFGELIIHLVDSGKVHLLNNLTHVSNNFSNNIEKK